MAKLTSESTSAARFVPPGPTLETAREASKGCRGCDLWKRGTQTVFGDGRRSARVVFIGEQPGDQEDLAGTPFVGPAGRILDKGLEQAGIDRRDAYVTNVVKHFKWEARGKRRIHKKPNAGEIQACRPWLDVELALVKPQVVVCLGATAAQALLGTSFKVTRHRGEIIEGVLEAPILATVHPSSILRAPDEESRRAEMARFVDDLKRVAERLQ
jgi:DNA polymerase